MTRSAIETAVRAWVLAASGLATGKVIFANEGGPRPVEPYATIKLTSIVAQGGEVLGAINTSGVQTLKGDRAVSVSVQVFGSGALDLAQSTARALATETTRSTLSSAGLAPQGIVPAVNELTEKLDTESEERAQFDALLAIQETYTDNVGLIEHVSGEGTFSSPVDDYVVPYTADKS